MLSAVYAKMEADSVKMSIFAGLLSSDMEPVQKDSFKQRMESHLLELCTSAGLLDGTLLSSPDTQDAWTRYAPAYFGDAVKEFNEYPEFTLACAGFLGMAVAHLWDKDWQAYENVPFSFFYGPRGFDDMDDHICLSILGEQEKSVEVMQEMSANAYHFLLKESPEPGTAEAYRMFLAAAEAMFGIGAAIELFRLGYRYHEEA